MAYKAQQDWSSVSVPTPQPPLYTFIQTHAVIAILLQFPQHTLISLNFHVHYSSTWIHSPPLSLLPDFLFYPLKVISNITPFSKHILTHIFACRKT